MSAHIPVSPILLNSGLLPLAAAPSLPATKGTGGVGSAVGSGRPRGDSAAASDLQRLGGLEAHLPLPAGSLVLGPLQQQQQQRAILSNNDSRSGVASGDGGALRLLLGVDIGVLLSGAGGAGVVAGGALASGGGAWPSSQPGHGLVTQSEVTLPLALPQTHATVVRAVDGGPLQPSGVLPPPPGLPALPLDAQPSSVRRSVEQWLLGAPIAGGQPSASLMSVGAPLSHQSTTAAGESLLLPRVDMNAGSAGGAVLSEELQRRGGPFSDRPHGYAHHGAVGGQSGGGDGDGGGADSMQHPPYDVAHALWPRPFPPPQAPPLHQSDVLHEPLATRGIHDATLLTIDQLRYAPPHGSFALGTQPYPPPALLAPTSQQPPYAPGLQLVGHPQQQPQYPLQLQRTFGGMDPSAISSAPPALFFGRSSPHQGLHHHSLSAAQDATDASASSRGGLLAARRPAVHTLSGDAGTRLGTLSALAPAFSLPPTDAQQQSRGGAFVADGGAPAPHVGGGVRPSPAPFPASGSGIERGGRSRTAAAPAVGSSSGPGFEMGDILVGSSAAAGVGRSSSFGQLSGFDSSSSPGPHVLQHKTPGADDDEVGMRAEMRR